MLLIPYSILRTFFIFKNVNNTPNSFYVKRILEYHFYISSLVSKPMIMVIIIMTVIILQRYKLSLNIQVK